MLEFKRPRIMEIDWPSVFMFALSGDLPWLLRHALHENCRKGILLG